MNKNNVIFLLLIILCGLIISGCTNEEKVVDINNEDQPPKEIIPEESKEHQNDAIEQELNAQPLPQSIKEVVEYPSGNFANSKTDDEVMRQELRSLPALSESASEQEVLAYYTYLYSLFKMDYPDPSDIIESFKYTVSSEDDIPSDVQEVEQYNVEVILDSSGSMANKIQSKTRMELAKESIQKYLSSMSDNANVALRVYGHKGTGADSDKTMSCAANELVYPLQPYDEAKINQSLQSFQPAGWTPLAQSMLEAINDFKDMETSNSRNIIYIVSDGIETCDGDPIKAAQALKDSGLSPVVNIIGFDVDNKGQAQLKEIAEAAGGTYVSVQNQDQLNKEFEKSTSDYYKWMTWKSKTTNDLYGFYAKQKNKIYSITNSWRNLAPQESYSIQTAITYLSLEQLISKEQQETMQKLREDFYITQSEKIKDFESVLQELNNENLEENLQDIENVFENSTANQ